MTEEDTESSGRPLGRLDREVKTFCRYRKPSTISLPTGSVLDLKSMVGHGPPARATARTAPALRASAVDGWASGCSDTPQYRSNHRFGPRRTMLGLADTPQAPTAPWLRRRGRGMLTTRDVSAEAGQAPSSHAPSYGALRG